MVSEVKESWISKHPVIFSIGLIFGFLFVVGFINGIINGISDNEDNSANINANVYQEESSQEKCTPNWDCDSWTECSKSGMQTRICTDLNKCETTYGKPKTSTSCAYEYKIGDRVVVDEIAYTLHSKTEESKVGEYYGYGDYQEFMGETADGIFYIFDLTVENIGKESDNFWGSNIKIYDSQGRTFDHDIIAEIYMDDSFSYEQLQPGLPKRGKIVFDIPKGLAGKLGISSTGFLSDQKEYISWE